MATAEQIVNEIRELGDAYKVRTTTKVSEGRYPEEVIVETAVDNNIDLIVLSTDLRPGSHRLFLGPRVEYILQHAPCPVLVLNTH
jgi:nucleotide-binding universal stress UspA family protein